MSLCSATFTGSSGLLKSYNSSKVTRFLPPKGRYECGGYIYSGEGQELGQFWAKLNVGNAKLQKTSSNTSIT
ncbi:hypothetical protein D1N53_22685, partial [Clostridioides difficile]